jgi:hypothetical protein
MLKVMLCALVITAAVAVLPARAENLFNNFDSRSISGSVVSVNVSNRTVTIGANFDETTIFVPAGIPITRNGQSADLSQINPGDSIAVTYYNTSPGPLKATKVDVQTK